VSPFYAEITKQLEVFFSSTPVEELEIVMNFFARMNTIREEKPPRPSGK
jgi:hypothetical protein